MEKQERESLRKYLGELLAPLTDHYTLSEKELGLWVETTVESMILDGVRPRLRQCRGCDERQEGLRDDRLCFDCEQTQAEEAYASRQEDR